MTIKCRLTGGPRDGETVDLEAPLLLNVTLDGSLYAISWWNDHKAEYLYVEHPESGGHLSGTTADLE